MKAICNYIETKVRGQKNQINYILEKVQKCYTTSPLQPFLTLSNEPIHIKIDVRVVRVVRIIRTKVYGTYCEASVRRCYLVLVSKISSKRNLKQIYRSSDRYTYVQLHHAISETLKHTILTTLTILTNPLIELLEYYA
jgi:hypothetical protein